MDFDTGPSRLLWSLLVAVASFGACSGGGDGHAANVSSDPGTDRGESVVIVRNRKGDSGAREPLSEAVRAASLQLHFQVYVPAYIPDGFRIVEIVTDTDIPIMGNSRMRFSSGSSEFVLEQSEQASFDPDAKTTVLESWSADVELKRDEIRNMTTYRMQTPAMGFNLMTRPPSHLPEEEWLRVLRSLPEPVSGTVVSVSYACRLVYTDGPLKGNLIQGAGAICRQALAEGVYPRSDANGEQFLVANIQVEFDVRTKDNSVKRVSLGTPAVVDVGDGWPPHPR